MLNMFSALSLCCLLKGLISTQKFWNTILKKIFMLCKMFTGHSL